MPDTREALLVRSFVALADTLVHDYDVIDLLQRLVDHAVELFDASAGGIILGPDAQHLEVVASTSEQSRFVSLMQLRHRARSTGTPLAEVAAGVVDRSLEIPLTHRPA